jgi:hypothetical protein
LTPSPKKAALEQTSSVIEDSESTLRFEITDEPFFEARYSDRSVRPASEGKSGILTVQVFVEPDPLATISGIARDFRREVRVPKERDKLAFSELVSNFSFVGENFRHSLMYLR